MPPAGVKRLPASSTRSTRNTVTPPIWWLMPARRWRRSKRSSAAAIICSCRNRTIAHVIEMPEFRRGNSLAYLDNAPPLDPKAESIYAVSPPPADWTPQQIRSFLEEYNSHMLKILTIHEAYPGHYVQLDLRQPEPVADPSRVSIRPVCRGLGRLRRGHDVERRLWRRRSAAAPDAIEVLPARRGEFDFGLPDALHADERRRGDEISDWKMRFNPKAKRS